MFDLEIYEHTWPALLTQISKLNARAKRHGLDGRFTADILDRTTRPITDLQGRRTGRIATVLTVAITAPVIRLGPWEFIGAVQLEQGGTVVHTRPGAALPKGYQRPDDHLCEHCQTRRHRTTSYLLGHPDGTIRQVGSTCIELFTGLKPRGLWSLTIAAELAAEYEADLSVEGLAAVPNPDVEVAHVLRVAYAVTDVGKHYVSRDKAAYGDAPATVGLVREVLAGPNPHMPPSVIDAINAQLTAARAVPAEVVDAIIAAGRDAGDSVYAENLAVVLAGDTVSDRSVGLVASAVSVWRRAQDQAVAAQDTTEGWFAPVKTRVRDVPVTVTKVRTFDNGYRLSQLILLRVDETGHVLKWFTSAADPEVGDRYLLTATVKEHDHYGGTDQTVVTRGKFAPAPALEHA